MNSLPPLALASRGCRGSAASTSLTFGRVRRLVEVGDVAPGGLDLLRRDRRGRAGRVLPSVRSQRSLREEAAADLEEAAGLLAALVAQPRDQRRDVLGLERVDDAPSGSTVSVSREPAIGAMVLTRMFLLHGPRCASVCAEADQPELGHRVVGLAEVAVDAGGRRGDDDAAVALLAHVRPGRVRDAEGAVARARGR